jgi:tetratricopeptide (TPR) repeat protein
MRHLRSLPSLGLWGLSIAWLLGVGQAVWATTPSQSLRLPQVPVELSIRVPVGEKPAAESESYRSFEGRLHPLEERLFVDAADGEWNDHSLLTAGLIASGVDSPARLEEYESRMTALAEELRSAKALSGTPRQQAQAVLEFLHGRVLHGGYQLDASDLAVSLDEGRFNCVSASVLFNCLADRVGLTTVGLEIPGHAMSRVVLADDTLDIETTCPEWFRLMDDPEKQAAMVEKRIGVRHSKETRDQRRVVSGVELVATIYYNRGVDLLSQKQFAEAVAANAKALRLDPHSTTARGNLLATLNNWAIELGTGGRYAEAIETLDRGIALDAGYATFKTNYVHVHHQWTEELGRKGQFQEAAQVLARARSKELDPGYFRRAQLDLYRRWVRACLESDRTDEAFDVLASARRQFGSAHELLDLEVAEINRQAARLVEEERLAEAVALLDRAVAWRPDAVTLLENHRTAVMHWAQPAFKQGDFAEAIRRTTHGSNPGQLDSLLMNNVRYGYYQWISQLQAGGQPDAARAVIRQALADPFLSGNTTGVVPPATGE